MITVSRLNITPVKGTQLREVESVRLAPLGSGENRRFFLIDDEDEMVNSLRSGALQTAVFSYTDCGTTPKPSSLTVGSSRSWSSWARGIDAVLWLRQAGPAGRRPWPGS